MHTKVLASACIILTLLGYCGLRAQDSLQVYHKRVLDKTEIDLMSSYYQQTGDHAAVSGGIGTEELTDLTPTVVIAIPLNADDILTIDAGISAYTSASSSNVNPFNGPQPASPFRASSGASHSDTWMNATGTYTHHSDDRTRIWSAKLSLSNEYDYKSLGIGASRSWLFNERNTELSLHGNVYLDNWKRIYPVELRPPGRGGEDDEYFNLRDYTITGNPDYNPAFTPLDQSARQSWSVGLNLSQIFSKYLQGSLSLDLVSQQGLLSTPFQRVYFSDVPDAYIEEFHLADDIERLPDTRNKLAIGGRLHYYLNEHLVARSYYRYYVDDWGVQSHTASIEIPIKIADKFTLRPSYRFYSQARADYFAPYNQHLSTETFYTSDYDLSRFTANQFGFGVSYSDILNSFHIGNLGLKGVDLKYHVYRRNTGLNASVISFGVHFMVD